MSLPPDLAGKFKAECARRQSPLNQVFGEMWTLYEKTAKKFDTGSVPRGHGDRKILGLSLSPEFARIVMAEASRRGVRLNQLFNEAWALYEKHSAKKKP